MERRLSAILATDVCNFSMMMSKDEDQTIDILHSCNAIIEAAISSHDGHIFNTAGDSIVAEFSSVVDAVNCAVSFQRTLQDRNQAMPETARMHYRVGINLGDIIIEGDNRYGDGINIAARLEALSEPGGICISGSVYGDIKSKLDLEFGALGEQALKNIAQPISVYKVTLDEEIEASIPLAMNPSIAQMVEETSGTDVKLDKNNQRLEKEKPSIAILPFNNMSGDPEQEYFSDGISEDITTALSNVGWLDVMARNSSFSYKGKSPDIRTVADELGVRYVLEGSIRKSGNRVRINAQLLEGRTAAHIWAEKYDRELVDIFDLQDEITTSVVHAIEPTLRQAEIDRAQRKHPESLDAYDLYLRALPGMYTFDPESNARSLDLLHRAIEIDPEYSEAIAMAAWAYEHRFTRGWPQYSSDDIESGAELARKAIETKTEDPLCLALSGFVLVMSQADVQLGILTVRRGLQKQTSNGLVYVLASAAFVFGNENGNETLRAESINAIEKAILLSPKDPMMFALYLVGALAYLETGELDKALDYADRSLDLNPAWDTSLQAIIAIHVESGNIELGKEYCKRLYAVDKDTSVSKVEDHLNISNHFIKSKMIAGLQAVGVPNN